MTVLTEPMLVFLSCLYMFQLVFISAYVSGQWRSQRRVLLNRYPQDKFPNLYVNSAKVEFQRLRIRKNLDFGVLGIGFAAFVVVFLLGPALNTLAESLVYLAIIQLVPLALSALWCTQNNKEMSKRYPQKIRAAAFTDPITTSLLPLKRTGLVIVLFLASWLCAGVVTDGFASSDGDKILMLQLLNTLMMAVIGLFLANILYGRNTDNFIAPEERKQKSRTKLEYLLNALVFYNLFIVAIVLTKTNEVDPLYVLILTSIFVQITVYTTRNQYLPINPNVYKEG